MILPPAPALRQRATVQELCRHRIGFYQPADALLLVSFSRTLLQARRATLEQPRRTMVRFQCARGSGRGITMGADGGLWIKDDRTTPRSPKVPIWGLTQC